MAVTAESEFRTLGLYLVQHLAQAAELFLGEKPLAFLFLVFLDEPTGIATVTPQTPRFGEIESSFSPPRGCG